jgi:hypothetical protein
LIRRKIIAVFVILTVKAEMLVDVAELLGGVGLRINCSSDLYYFFKLRHEGDILLRVRGVVLKRLTHHRDIPMIVVEDQS